MAFQGFFGGFFPTLVDSFRPVVAHSFDPASGAARLNWPLMVGNVLFLVTLVCVMTYFFFSFEHNKPGIRQARRWALADDGHLRGLLRLDGHGQNGAADRPAAVHDPRLVPGDRDDHPGRVRPEPADRF